MKHFILIFLFAFGFNAQIFANEETPYQAIKEIMNLYKTKDFETLVKDRYAELHKAKSDTEVQKVIQMFSKKFSGDKILNRILAIYEITLAITPEIVENPNPQITETNKMAIFKMEKGEMKLYLLKTGKWGFHI